MKFFLPTILAIAILCIFSTALGQQREMDKTAALSLVQKTKDAVGFNDEELKNLKVIRSYTDAQYNATYIYLIQTYKGVAIYNQIVVLAYKNGSLVSKAGTLLPNPSSMPGADADMPALRAEDAVSMAASHVKAGKPVFEIPAMPHQDGRMHFGQCRIAYEEITSELFWVPNNRSNKQHLSLSWQVNLAPNGTSDHWSIRINALSGEIVGKNNFTVYENHADEGKHTGVNNNPENYVSLSSANSPMIVNQAFYNVIAFPLEAPSFGAATLVSNPWTLAGASNPNATTLNWHSDGTTDYNITRGNNVWATEDRASANQNSGLPATSSTSPDPLTFNTVPDYTVVPTNATFQQFAITNLFYWNNICHDIAYNYGFTEAAANFQKNNLGRGGAQADDVMALAQSGTGTNNANFSTPSDGGRGRMRMYIWTAANPDRDSDLDNGVIAHEYAHGISNRLTGGGGAGCLSNAEQAGEGWSDYFGLMLTTDWATASITDGATKPRGIGTYVWNQAPSGGGIRNYRYCTDMTVNPLTYAWMNSGTWGEVHNIGEIWCATLWDMTWNIIQMGGINPNLFNAAGTGGNSIALRLVMEGMKLQTCSPGFIDSRDGILAADQLLYGGQYRCAIMNAFARRGMGFDAKQGSSGSTGDQTAGFSLKEASLTMTQSVTQQQEGLNVTYNNIVKAGACAPISNFLVTDTLPANVTWVSGGTYNAANRVVSFNVNQAAGSTQTYSFTVSINTGSYYPTATLFDDAVPAGTLPNANFTQTSTTATQWSITSAQSHSAPSSYFGPNISTPSDQRLTQNTQVAMGANPSKLYFWHLFNTEGTYDGGVLEVSTDNGTTWNDIGETNFINNGYNGTFDASVPVGAGRKCWTGGNGSFKKVVVNMAPYVNQNVRLRFRFLSDNGTNVEGWYVDDISILRQAMVDIKSQIFNDAGVKLATTDTFTIILPGSCATAAISTQPVASSVCEGSSATFTAAANGTAPTYQWQVSTTGGCGGNFVNISGATSATLTVANVTAAMTGYAYRVLVTNTCTSTLTSDCAVLTVTPGTSIVNQPTSATACAGGTLTYSTTASGTGLTYVWQYSINGGTSWTGFSPAQTGSTLTINNVPASNNGYLVRVLVTGTGTCASTVTSSTATMNVNSTPAITSQPANFSTCPATSASFTAATSAVGATYQWQVSTTGCGGTFTNISGATSATLNISNVTTAMNGYAYNVIVTNSCGATTSSCATLTVSPNTAITSQPSSATACAGTDVTFNSAATGATLAYNWQVSTDGGTSWNSLNPAVTTPSLTLTGVTAGMSGYQYRMVANSTGSCTGTATTNAVTLTVNTPASITTQPSAITTCPGTSVNFTVAAGGTNVGYQWQVSTTGCAGTFTNIAGATSATLALSNVQTSMNGYAYKLVVTNSCATVNSNCVVLNVNTTVNISQQPSGATGCVGTNAVFTTAASGTGLAYQWQVSTDGGANWTNITGATSATLTVSITAALNNNRYRALITSTCNTAGTTTNAATLTAYAIPVVTASPQSVSKCVGTATTFTVGASDATAYQWQVSTDGGTTWTSIAGATTASLPLTNLTLSQNGYRYRVIIGNNNCGNATSAAATLNVSNPPVVSIITTPAASSPLALSPTATVTLSASITPSTGNYTYQWYQNNTLVSGSASTRVVSIDDIGTYKVTVSDATTGCTATSSNFVVNAEERKELFIYPNPTSGLFWVRYFNPNSTATTRTITVFDSKGARVFAKQYPVATAYQKMEVNISNHGAGEYLVELSDNNGTRIVIGKILKL